MLRFGEISGRSTEPGLYFKSPVASTMPIPIENRLLSFESTDNGRAGVRRQALPGRCRHHAPGGRPAALPRDRSARSLRLAWARIKTRLDAALRQTYGLRDFDAALSKDRAAMMREIRDQVRPEALRSASRSSTSASGAPT